MKKLRKRAFIKKMETNMHFRASPLLSIITINRNNADGLRKTIESVVTQNYDNFEYIIIDGASIDGSVDIIKEYAEHPLYGKKISYWISEPDTGIYNAMNKGIRYAQGTYVYMLNSGDWLEPDALLNIIDKLKAEKPDLLLFLLNFWDTGEKIQSEIRFPEKLRISTMCHQGLVYKKAFHIKYNLYDENYNFAADYDFCIKCFYGKNIKISTVFLPLANFQSGGLGVSELSAKEFSAVQRKYGFMPPVPPKAILFIKKGIKFFIPYGLVFLYRKISDFLNKG